MVPVPEPAGETGRDEPERQPVHPVRTGSRAPTQRSPHQPRRIVVELEEVGEVQAEAGAALAGVVPCVEEKALEAEEAPVAASECNLAGCLRIHRCSDDAEQNQEYHRHIRMLS